MWSGLDVQCSLCVAAAAAAATAMKLRLHFVVDPMGWLCISVVLAIWLYNTLFIPKLVLLPHYNEGHIPWAIVLCECSHYNRDSVRPKVRFNAVCPCRLLCSIGALHSSTVQSFHGRSGPASCGPPHSSRRYEGPPGRSEITLRNTSVIRTDY